MGDGGGDVIWRRSKKDGPSFTSAIIGSIGFDLDDPQTSYDYNNNKLLIFIYYKK